MRNNTYNQISKEDFMNLKEEDVMFITNPGRMGDEDGITFIVKNGNSFITYRVDGWMYPNKDLDEKYKITYDDAIEHFPKWYESWQNGNDNHYKGKYKHLYMGFGNGLNIDYSIYEDFKPYLEKVVEKNLEQYLDEEEKKEMQYAAIFNVWEEAVMKMMEEKNIILK